MKKATLLCGLLLAVTASMASAAGTSIRWGNCAGDAGLPNRTFACNSNTGTNLLVASFELGEDILASSGQELVIDIATASNPLPAWWGLKNAGSCRAASLIMNTVISGAAVACTDWASGAAVGGIGAYQLADVGDPFQNKARIKIAIAVPGTSLVDLFGATEYFSCNININNAKTVGAGNCAGCSDPACIVFNSIKVTTQIGANDRTIFGPANGTDSNFCTWQGGVGVNTGRGTGCPLATPTRNATWGQVKGLYR